MSAGKLMLILTVVLVVIAVSALGALTGTAADGTPQPNQPAMSTDPESDDGNENENGKNENGESKDDSDGSINQADAEKAKAAALEVAGGGAVQDVETGDDGNSGWYEVEIQRPDGTEVEVQLDENFSQRAGGDEAEDGDEQEGPNDD